MATGPDLTELDSLMSCLTWQLQADTIEFSDFSDSTRCLKRLVSPPDLVRCENLIESHPWHALKIVLSREKFELQCSDLFFDGNINVGTIMRLVTTRNRSSWS